MKIDSTSFGRISIDGKEYEHDVWIYPNGRIEERTRNHEILADEIKMFDADVIVIGLGQSGVAHVSDEAMEYAQKNNITLYAETTPGAIEKYNKIKAAGSKVAAIIHVTC